MNNDNVAENDDSFGFYNISVTCYLPKIGLRAKVTASLDRAMTFDAAGERLTAMIGLQKDAGNSIIGYGIDQATEDDDE